MNLIVEGPDRSGKTTIAKALAKELNHQYFRINKGKNYFTKKDFYQQALTESNLLLQLIQQTKQNLIIDRSIPSEFVFSKVFNRDTDLVSIIDQDRALAEEGVILLYCYKDYYKIDDDLVDMNRVEEIKKRYEDYLKISHMRKIILNTTDENLLRQLSFIKGELVWKGKK